MTPTTLIPMDAGGHGLDEAHGFFEHSFGLLALLVLLAAAAITYLLVRRGIVKLPALTGLLPRTPSPELGARTILAERFARGDLTPDEFLERASYLNWTPGVDAPGPRPLSR